MLYCTIAGIQAINVLLLLASLVSSFIINSILMFVGATTLSCYKSNTKKSKTVSYCSTNVTIGGSCYHLIRKSSDGLVLSERHGCSERCKEENRNRAVRTCCNTTLCNFVNINPPNTDSGIPLIPIPPLVLETDSTSSAIQPSQTETLSTAINHPTVISSQSNVIDNTVAALTATGKNVIHA